MVDKKLVEYLKYELDNKTDLVTIHKNLLGKYSSSEIHEAMDYILYSPFNHFKVFFFIICSVLVVSSFTYSIIYPESFREVGNFIVVSISDGFNHFITYFIEDSDASVFKGNNNSDDPNQFYCSFFDEKFNVSSYICDKQILRVCNNVGIWEIFKVCNPNEICNPIDHACISKDPGVISVS